MAFTEPSFKRFVFILIDGAPYAVFRGLLEKGDLPNIKKYVVDRGSLNKAISVFPSTTGPAFIPFFMGLYPGTANIPGIRWLSKSDFHFPHYFKRPGICSYMGLDGLRFEATAFLISEGIKAKQQMFEQMADKISQIQDLRTELEAMIAENTKVSESIGQNGESE